MGINSTRSNITKHVPTHAHSRTLSSFIMITQVQKCTTAAALLLGFVAAVPPAPRTIEHFDADFCASKHALKHDGNYPFPEQCSAGYYYTCVSQITRTERCPAAREGLSLPQLVYNEQYDACDYPQNVNSCQAEDDTAVQFSRNATTTGNWNVTTPENDATTAENIVTTEGQQAFCVGKDDGNYAYADCSEQFYQCANGETYVQECPEKLVYDVVGNICNYPTAIPSCIVT